MKVLGKIIYLYSGEPVFIDEEDYAELSRYKWYLFKSEKWQYAIRFEGNKTIFMHRQIMRVEDSNVYVDHRNGNGLDNRKRNLRMATNSQNQYNTGKKSNSKQKYKCIRQLKSGKFEVRMRLPNKTRLCKSVNTEQEAIALYNSLAKEYHGEFAVLIE